jgi:flagellar biogenesis protein FliO
MSVTRAYSLNVLGGAVAGVCVLFVVLASGPLRAQEATTASTRPAATQPTQPESRPLAGIGVRDEHTPLALPRGQQGMELGKTLGYAMLVVLLAAGAMLATRKYLPRLAPGIVGKRIRLIESFHLAPRKQLHVVEVDKQRFLLASSRDNVTMLSELRAGSFGEALTQAEAGAPSGEEGAA